MVYWETVGWSPHHPLWLVGCFNHPLLLASGRTPHETLGASQLSPVVAASIPKFAAFWIAGYRYSKSPFLFHWNADFKPNFFVETKVPHNFLLKCPFSPLKPPPYQWTPRFCRWNPWPRCLLRKASRRLQEALQPSGRPSLIWSPVRRLQTCKLNPAVQPILITFNWYPNRFLIQLQLYLLS